MKIASLIAILISCQLTIAGDWPVWRGPNGNSMSTETDLLQEWPAEGPNQLWTNPSIGQGFSSPIIAGDSIYITGDVDKKLMIYALTLDGKQKWVAQNGKAWGKSFKGSRASCHYVDGKLYHVGSYGNIVCLDATNGTPLWSVDLLKKYKSRNGIWGVSDMIALDGDIVYAAVCGENALVVAFNKETGKELWKTPNTTSDNYSYASPILADINGVKQLVSCGTRTTFAVDINNGKQLWSFPHQYKKKIVLGLRPVFAEGSLFITNTAPRDAITYRLNFENGKPVKGWETQLGNSCSGGIIVVNNMVIGGSHRQKKDGFLALDSRSGEVIAAKKDTREAAVVYGNGRIYSQEANGTLFLLSPEKDTFKVHGKVSVGKAKDCWAHPVIANGKLYLRYDTELFCYDIRQ